jgi:aspartyl-tRNA(Asn)/glutamyl-tRNA(Gln) amidotransferase subunit C
MKLTEKQVCYVAKLANLTLTEAEVVRMTGELSGILEHMDRLAGINTDGVEPMRQVIASGEDSADLRPDVERESLSNELALGNAAVSGNGFFKVPRVIER